MPAFEPFRRYAEFDGRSGRREFWQFVLLQLGVSFALPVNRSVIREDKGDMAGARADQDRAVSLWPHEPTFRSNRAMRSIRLGAFDRAQADVDAGLARAPEEARC